MNLVDVVENLSEEERQAAHAAIASTLAELVCTPTNTREACAYQQGQRGARLDKANPHKKKSVDYTWWQMGFDAEQRNLEVTKCA